MRALALLVAALVVASCAAVPAPAVGAPLQRHAAAPTHEMGGMTDAGSARFAMGPCESGGPPLGAIPAGPPAWCFPLVAGVSTAHSSANSWIDDFDSGMDHAAFPKTYRVFEAAKPASTITLTRHFMHNAHWMVDVAGSGAPPDEYEGERRDALIGTHWGGALMRPDRTFRFADGRLVVEFDMAAGMLAYHDGWPEIVVTTAAAPTGSEVDPIHAIGIFGGAPSVGLRLYTDRTALSSAYDATGRIFELSSERNEGASVSFGGSPSTPPLAAPFPPFPPPHPATPRREPLPPQPTTESVQVWSDRGRY